MTRRFVPLLATSLMVVAVGWCSPASAQQPSTAAPEPMMPAMPSMEGQQGDVSKPVTQIPPRKKPAAAEKKSPAKETPAASAAKKTPKPARVAKSRKNR